MQISSLVKYLDRHATVATQDNGDQTIISDSVDIDLEKVYVEACNGKTRDHQ